MVKVNHHSDSLYQIYRVGSNRQDHGTGETLNMAMRELVTSLGMRLPVMLQHSITASHLPAGASAAASVLTGQRRLHAGRINNPWEEVRASSREAWWCWGTSPAVDAVADEILIC